MIKIFHILIAIREALGNDVDEFINRSSIFRSLGKEQREKWATKIKIDFKDTKLKGVLVYWVDKLLPLLTDKGTMHRRSAGWVLQKYLLLLRQE